MYNLFIRFIKSWFHKEPLAKVEHYTDVPPDDVVPSMVEPVNVENSVIDTEAEHQSKIYSRFSHSRNRLSERYNLTLTYDIWQGWNTQIRSNNPVAVFVSHTDTGGDVWRVWYGHHVVFVVFRDDMIVTVLPVTDRYITLARKNLQARNLKQPVSVQAGKPSKVSLPDTKQGKETMPASMQKFKSAKLERCKNKYVT